MPRALYSLLLTLAMPVVVSRLLAQSLSRPARRARLGERFARFRLPEDFDPSAPVIWVHAVSVGETAAAAPLVRALPAAFPGAKVVMTGATPAGAERAAALFGDAVTHLYAPYDLPGAVARFVDRMRPRLLIIMETELWPNMIHVCRRRGVKVLLASARLSEKSARGYRRLGGLARGMLAEIDAVGAQSGADAERLAELGAAPDRLTVTGSLKFHVDTGAAKGGPLFDSIRASGRPVILAASTREGEEPAVLDAFARLRAGGADPLLLLVPRHPERFDKAAALCRARGFETVRRSGAAALDPAAEVLLGDSMGEMADWCAAADVAFVGGSLVDTGCQNVLEPAAFGLPVVVGPSRYNFAAACDMLEAAGALAGVKDGDGLAALLAALLADPARRARMGAAGRAVIAQNQRALGETLALAKGLLA